MTAIKKEASSGGQPGAPRGEGEGPARPREQGGGGGRQEASALLSETYEGSPLLLLGVDSAAKASDCGRTAGLSGNVSFALPADGVFAVWDGFV